MEQWEIMCLRKASCIYCEAGFNNLESDTAGSPRSGKAILDELKTLRATWPTATTYQFVKKAKEQGLSPPGRDDPCWAGLLVDICDVMCCDVLHGMHKFFKDHVMSWITNTVGKDELDQRFKAQPHQTGLQSFSSGISHISQWSGKEHRDLQRHILPVIAGAPNVTPSMVKAVRAILDSRKYRV